MKKIIKNNILGFILGIILTSTTTFAATILFQSNQVRYDNTTSGLTATDVQDAIDEIYSFTNNFECKNGFTKENSTTYKYECSKPIPNPVSFETDDWEVIINAVRNNNTDLYPIGSTKQINLGTFGTQTVRISNKSTPAECATTGFSQTACGFVLEFTGSIGSHEMASTNSSAGGWPASTMRSYLNEDFYNEFPTIIKNAIVDTTVVSGYGRYSGESNFTSIDKIYLLSSKEIGFDSNEDFAKSETRTMDYYANNNINDTRKKLIGNTTYGYRWWLRTPYTNLGYTLVDNDGSETWSNSNGGFSASPAFKIG